MTALSSIEWQEPFKSLVRIRGSEALLPQYIAVQVGLRRSLDDWIPARRLTELEKFLSGIGLITRVDCAFLPIKEKESATGLEYAPTTRAAGAPWHLVEGEISNRDVLLHIVVASRPEWADEALKSAWYPLVIDGKVVRKPLKDHEWLGQAFGYPSCCVAAFVRDNEWRTKNIYAEVANRSRSVLWRTNCFPKLTAWTSVFHIPCAFDCPATIQFSSDLLAEIAKLDSFYRSQIELKMKQPVITMSERSAFALHNAKFGHESISYSGVTNWYLSAAHVETIDKHRGELLRSGDHVKFYNGTIMVERNGSLCGVVEPIWHDDVTEVPKLLRFE